MTLTLDDYPVTLWMVGGIPARVMHEGRRWRVTDSPTELHESEWVIPLVPAGPLVGWRFQANDDSGESRVFDVVRQDDGGWVVLRAWI